MTERNKVKNIFLDAQVFESNQFDFGNKTFQALITAVAAGLVRVYSTEVTQREIEKRLKQRTAEAVGHLKTFSKNLKVRCIHLEPFVATQAQARISIDDAQNNALEQLRGFWKSARVEVVPISGTDVRKVFDDYFSVKPPFGSKDKKAEFPDAFAADALASWCASKKQKMNVVTDDGDWEALCKDHPNFIHKKQLAEVLAAFPDPRLSKAIRETLIARKDDIAALLNTSLTASLVNTSVSGATITEVIIKKTELCDIYVIYISEGSATVEVRCRFVYVLRLRYDPVFVTHKVPRRRKASGKVATKARAIAELGVTFDPKKPSDVKVDSTDVRQLARPFADDW